MRDKELMYTDHGVVHSFPSITACMQCCISDVATMQTGLMGSISASAVMACAAAYDADAAVQVLFRLEQRGVCLHKFAYHHVMTALASAGDIQQALMIWHHMDVCFPFHSIPFHCRTTCCTLCFCLLSMHAVHCMH
jgi:pentatricopeptide repeat protein